MRTIWSFLIWIILILPLFSIFEGWEVFKKGIQAGRSAQTYFFYSLLGSFVFFSFFYKIRGFLTVFFHEVTHMIFVFIMGGEVKKMEAGEYGGAVWHRVGGKPAQALVALSPYFFFPGYLLIILKPWLKAAIIPYLAGWIGLCMGYLLAETISFRILIQPDLRVLTPIISYLVIIIMHISFFILWNYIFINRGFNGWVILFKDAIKKIWNMG